MADILKDLLKNIAVPLFNPATVKSEHGLKVLEFFKRIDTFLQKTQGLVLGGLKVSYVDFILYELSQLGDFIADGRLKSTYPVIAYYCSIVENLPRLSEFI